MKFNTPNMMQPLRLILALSIFVTILAFEHPKAQAEVDPSSTSENVASQQQPKDVIEKTIADIVNTVEEFPTEAQTEARRQKLEKLIEPRFDFKEMARRALGSHWKKIKEDEQAEFVEVFSQLLSRTYLSHVETVKPGMVSILDQKVKPQSNVGGFSIAIVHTDVTHKGEVFPLNYKMVQRSTGWMVYDVVIENIGLVSNYRNEFSGVIRKEGFDGLLDSLKKKLKS